MTEYSTARVQGAFIMGHPEWERDLQGDDLIGSDFDRWLRKVQAEAFNEGASAYGLSFWDGDAGVVENPYV